MLKSKTIVPVLFFIQFLFAMSVGAQNYTGTYQVMRLQFGAPAPDVRYYVQDSQGRMSGADPNAPMTAAGQQLVGVSPTGEVNQIPGASVDQVNLWEPENNDASSNTSWEIDVDDPGPQTFNVLYTTQLPVAANWIVVCLFQRTDNSLTRTEIPIIAKNGFYASAQIVLNTDGTLSVSRTASSINLLEDTQSACSLADIKPAEACEVLEDLASGIDKAINKKDIQTKILDLKRYLLVLNRLNFWGKQGYPSDWNDLNAHPECAPLCNAILRNNQFYINPEAYSALKFDAEILLNIPHNCKKFFPRKHGKRTKRHG